jgi:hypothetical protein
MIDLDFRHRLLRRRWEKTLLLTPEEKVEFRKWWRETHATKREIRSFFDGR